MIDIENLNIENDVQIDKYNLDSECISLPGLYLGYAEAARQAKSFVSEKSDMLKVVLAERQLAIREQCANEGKKVTEGIIAAMVDCDPDVIQARKDLREAEAVATRLNVAVTSMEIKKSEVDNLVKLHCNQIYVSTGANTNGYNQADVNSEMYRKTMNPLPNKN